MALSALPAAWAAEEPAKLEKIMVTGSLAEPTIAAELQRLEKILVTGALAEPAVAAEPQKLEKILVTGSLADAVVGGEPQKLEKIMVTGSLEKPVARLSVGQKRYGRFTLSRKQGVLRGALFFNWDRPFSAQRWACCRRRWFRLLTVPATDVGRDARAQKSPKP